MRTRMTVVPIFVLLCGVGFCSFVSYNLVRMPALAPFAETLGAGPVTVGFIVAASTMTGILLKLPVGTLSDLVNRPRLMLIGVLAFALPPFVYPFVPNLEVLTVLRVVHGLATAVFTPLALAMVADLYPATRGAALGWYTSAAQGGALLGPMLGGWIIDTAGYTETFLTGGGFGLAALAFYLALWWRYPAPSRTVKLEPKVLALERAARFADRVATFPDAGRECCGSLEDDGQRHPDGVFAVIRAFHRAESGRKWIAVWNARTHVGSLQAGDGTRIGSRRATAVDRTGPSDLRRCHHGRSSNNPLGLVAPVRGRVWLW